MFCLSGRAAATRANCCAECAAAMPRLLKACRQCAAILEYSVAGANAAANTGSNFYEDEQGYLCPSCYAKPPPLDFIWSPYLYFPPLNRALLQLKFQQRTSYAPALGYLWRQAYNHPAPHNKPEGGADLIHDKDGKQRADGKGPHIPAGGVSGHGGSSGGKGGASADGRGVYDLILPMPLHQQRQNQRGFNQATLLIAPLAKQLGMPVSSGKRALVLRSKATQPQMSLPPQERAKNLRNAFSVNPKQGAADIKGKKILIVDDIITSGASVFELARVLKHNGAGRVAAWALLRA